MKNSYFTQVRGWWIVLRLVALPLMVVWLSPFATPSGVQLLKPLLAQDGGTQDEAIVEAAAAPTGRSGSWNLIFSTDFVGNGLNGNRWVTCFWWDKNGCTIATNKELQWYVDENILIDSGVLRLRAEQRSMVASDGMTYPYVSGMISSGRKAHDLSQPVKFAFRYGYAEIRAYVPRGKGLWPAFWLLPVTHQSVPEIDIMEILGDSTNSVHMGLHYYDSAGVRQHYSTRWYGPDLASDWHIFAVDWRPDSLVWYVDGSERFRYTGPYSPAIPMYIIANLAVGGTYPGAPNGSTPFPSDFQIDWVRIWNRHTQASLTPTDDTIGDSNLPTTVLGYDPYLYVDGSPQKTIYLKYDTSALISRTITSARLRIQTTADASAGSLDSQQVKLVNSTSWSEGHLTHNNRPTALTTILGRIRETRPNIIYDIHLDIPTLQGKLGQVISLAIDSQDGDGLYLFSKESGKAPQLLLTTLSSASIAADTGEEIGGAEPEETVNQQRVFLPLVGR